ncbi:hypothetical protein SAMN02745135_01493 [Caloranaerobacter azorensis DSM 13643]|uniref:Uncharacterized protein n=1 Tax=Caloranaerobacter azorensis DSM 13643 TaxID=1121264 RepID=A0A1M5UMC3_9FIRM|nr:hypothetical protein [Caloranaerobacter azorensis]SHH64155.1 hypothetical protein SAMN02745135_01493 [Caloranaerobacter azorensis DSM 13643]
MCILKLTDYKAEIAERICIDRFENDLMLALNNFSERDKKSTIQLIKNSIIELEEKGVIFDLRLINLYCIMNLGLAWSMYRKGKIIQKEESVIGRIFKIDEIKLKEKLIIYLTEQKNYKLLIEDISYRYFTLYLSRHVKDIMNRMEVGFHPSILDEVDLKNVFINFLKKFSVDLLIMGIIDEYQRCSD